MFQFLNLFPCSVCLILFCLYFSSFNSLAAAFLDLMESGDLDVAVGVIVADGDGMILIQIDFVYLMRPPYTGG